MPPPPPPPPEVQHQQMLAAQQRAQYQALMAAQAQQQERAAAYARHVQQQQAVRGLEARRQAEYEQRQRAREEAKLKAGSGGGMQGQPARPPPPVTFLKKDFPSLGEDVTAAAGGAGTGGADPSDKVAAGDEPLLSVPGADQGQGRGPVPPPTAPTQAQARTQPTAATTRLLFNNPTPNAPPISANHVRSYFFTPRDLCYVVHSMMRPLITLDAYNDDYYRWGYDDRRARNLLSLGGNTPTGNNTLPNPVWKETKAKAQHIEDKYRGNVEKRADKWSTKQQTLGRTVKVNVKRPKALLATTGAALTMGATNDNDEQREDRSDEDRARISLWSARMAIDRGYRAYLDLLETRRLLQTRGGGLETESEADRRAELTRDVEGNVAALHGSLGITVAVSSSGGDGGGGERTIEVDSAVLSRTLNMSKGRLLLSRVLDDGVLPHSSARRVLSPALGAILSTTTAGAAGTSPSGEDRLVRSLTGLVQTAQPSLAPQDLVDCLAEFGRVYQSQLASSQVGSAGDTVRAMLGGQRVRMELLHAVLSRGNVVCAGGAGADVAAAWKAGEAEFMTILSAMNA